MKTQLIAAVALCAATQLLNAEDPNPPQVVHSRPAPPAQPAVAPARAPQPRPQVAQPRTQGVAPNVAGTHGLGLGGGVYRSVPPYTARQFHPTAGLADYARNSNRTPNTVTTGVTPRAANVPQQNATASTNGRTWNQNGRTWNGRTSNPTAANGTQNPGNRGTNNWRGGDRGNHNNYANWQDARRRYDHHRHDRDWWRSHHNHIVFVNRGYYYWDAGWWYPAWGYDPAAEYYAYDGPIYGYDGLSPDQVIGNVQTALQQEGYYQGAVDGELGPMTRQALAAWQRDHGLAITTAIDYPTLASLGLS